MINVLRQNSGKCIQWTVQSATSPLICDTFPFQDRKCYLELSLGPYTSNSNYSTSYLKFKSNGILKPPVKIIVHGAIAPNSSSSQGVITINQEHFITSEYQTIWSYSNNSNLFLSLLTFDIIIYDDSSKCESFFIIVVL